MSQVVLITGASGGLGIPVTKALLATGANVVATSRSILQSQFPDPNFVAVPADLTRAEEAKWVADTARDKFGRIDVLVHVMGGFASGAVHETDDATWNSMRDLNLTSSFNIFRAVLPTMREQRAGKIIAIGSLAAEENSGGIAAYAVFKSALAALVQSVAKENREFGITANIVLPGTIDTPANRQWSKNTSGWVPPEAIAELIIFLASGAGEYVNGAAIPVRGRSDPAV